MKQEDGAYNTFKLGDLIELKFQVAPKANLQDSRTEKDLIEKFKLVDLTVDLCEKQIGIWQPQHKFMQLYPHLDFLCDKIEGLNGTVMDQIGNRAKELNKELEEILRNLNSMNNVNYEKNKIDYLFEILEKSIESEEQVNIVTDRLKALEKIHKESPNMEA